VTSSSQPGYSVFSITLGLTVTCLTACGGGAISGGTSDSSYAYVISATAQDEQTPGVVLQFSIGADGSLTRLSTASVPSGAKPVAIASDPTGRYVYVANEGDGTISQYSVGVGGVLTALNPATVSVGAPSAAGLSLSVNPNGHSLYVVITPRDPPAPPITSIAQYSIGSNGTLSPTNPASIGVAIVAGGPLTLDPSGAYAYLAGESVVGEAETANAEVLQFSVGAGGELTQLASASVAATREAVNVVIAPDGRTAYVLSSCIDNNCDGQIAQYTVGATGTLTPTGITTPSAGHVIPISLVTDTSASGAYLLTNFMGVDTNVGAVYQYALNSAGALSPATPPSLNVSSGAVTQNVLATNLYVLSSNAVGFASGSPAGGHIDRYSIGSGGLLTAAGTMDIAAGYPTAMTVVTQH
jgi:6-phosphogluconolactonase (cycloisomerase 2 family)